MIDIITSLTFDSKNPTIFCAFHLAGWDYGRWGWNGEDSSRTSLADSWMKVLGTPLIPFTVEKREKLKLRAEERIPKVLSLQRQLAIMHPHPNEDEDEAVPR